MKLKNKKTGEIAELIEYGQEIAPHEIVEFVIETENKDYKYKSLAELNSEWEDYEEPEGYWFIDCYSVGVESVTNNDDSVDKFNKEIGNYFESEEEAEKAVEKLKAWKRLKEAGFIINSWNGNLGGGDHYDCCGQVNITAEVGDEDKRDTVKSDLDLLFSGEGD